jgi:hypothetical protein
MQKVLLDPKHPEDLQSGVVGDTMPPLFPLLGAFFTKCDQSKLLYSCRVAFRVPSRYI